MMNTFYRDNSSHIPQAPIWLLQVAVWVSGSRIAPVNTVAAGTKILVRTPDVAIL
jgi:hypothetical protein